MHDRMSRACCSLFPSLAGSRLPIQALLVRTKFTRYIGDGRRKRLEAGGPLTLLFDKM